MVSTRGCSRRQQRLGSGHGRAIERVTASCARRLALASGLGLVLIERVARVTPHGRGVHRPRVEAGRAHSVGAEAAAVRLTRDGWQHARAVIVGANEL